MNTNNINNSNIKLKAPKAKLIPKYKYFRIGVRDSNRTKNIKEGMNHLFTQRNRELEEVFLQEATQYTERILGETRKIQFTEEEDHEAMNVIFNNSIEEVAGLNEERLETEEIINGEEEERLEKEADDDTLDSDGVLELQERIQREDQEEYDRIRAELDEEEANKNN